MQIFNCIGTGSCSHINHTLNGIRRGARSAIEGEKPPLTAGVAVIDSKWAIVVNAKASIR